MVDPKTLQELLEGAGFIFNPETGSYQDEKIRNKEDKERFEEQLRKENPIKDDRFL